MEPGWQRNVVVAVLAAAFVAGYGGLAVDEGKAFGDGVVEALWLSAWLLAIVATERLIRSMRVRFAVLALSLAAISAVEQLITDGRATWTAAAWAVGAAAVLIAIELIVAAVSRRTANGERPTET